MKLTNVTVPQLEYLQAALREPTWAAAAAEVGVSASAFSQGIAELEKRLGVELFERVGRRREPLPAAHEASRHADRILAEFGQLTRWSEDVREGERGRINVGMIDTAAVFHFGDLLARFSADHPAVDLRLTVQPSGELLDRLAVGELDLLVCVAPDPASSLVVAPIIAEPLYVYAPPSATIGEPGSWGPWVGFPEASRSRGVIAGALRRRGIDYSVVAESSQPAVLCEMVRLGMGWTVLSAVDAEGEPHALMRAHPEPVAERILALVQRSDRTASPALRRLADELVVAAAADAPGRRS